MISIFLSFALFTPAQAQQDKSEISSKARSVISKFIRAKGGEAALKKIKDVTIMGEIISENQTVCKFEIYQAVNRHLSINRFPNGVVRRHGTDGKIVWSQNDSDQPTILQGQAARDYIRQHETLHESLEWNRQFKSILYAGEKTIDDETVHHLIFLATDQRQTNRYFSKKTGLLVQEESVVEVQGTAQVDISKIRNYVRDKKSGVMVSRSRLNYYGSGYTAEFKVTSLESNTLSDTRLFDIPKSVAERIKQSQN